MVLETWKPVVGLEGRYFVAADGRVARLKKGAFVERRAYVSNRGYLTLQLPGPSGRFVTRTVHSVVAEAFLGARPDGAQINHKNGNKLDNSASNLEWVTARQNLLHAIKTGLRKTFGPGFRGPPRPQSGEGNYRAKLSSANVDEIRSRLANGESGKALAKEYGVSTSLVSYIRTGKRWAA